jgi:hypothetical protein
MKKGKPKALKSSLQGAKPRQTIFTFPFYLFNFTIYWPCWQPWLLLFQNCAGCR